MLISLLEQKKPAYFSQIHLLPWICYKQQIGQILVSELATIFQKIYFWVFPSVLKRYKYIWLKSVLGSYLYSFYAFIFFYSALLYCLNYLNCLNCCLKMITSFSQNLYCPHFFIPGNNKYYTIILINSSYPSGHNLLLLRVTLLWQTFLRNKCNLLEFSRADLELIWGRYTNFRDTGFGRRNTRNVEKEKIMFRIKIKKLPSVTLFSKLNIESEHIYALNRTNKLS